MAKGNIHIGLDIGTSTIRTVVGSYKKGDERVKIIGRGESLSSGMRRGVVIDIDEATECIKKSIEQAELSSGISIDHAFLSVGGNHINIMENKGLVAVSRADQEVSVEDINRVIDSASAISLPSNREIIHIIPKSFKLDNEDDIQDPLGMTGARLEVEALIIDGLAPFNKNLTKCANNLGIEIDGLVLNVLAAAQAVLSKKQKELGVMVLDLGGGTASMAVYEEGKLLHAHVLPVGSAHVTNDIAIGLRTTIELAEKIKLKYGCALASEIKKKEMINLAELDEKEEGEVSRLEVARIIEARIQEIFELVNKELKKINRQRLLPAGAVLVGGGALMPKIVDLAKKELGLPVQIGRPTEIDGIVEEVAKPTFATAVGLVMWGATMPDRSQGQSFLSNISTPSTINKIKKWFRAFLP